MVWTVLGICLLCSSALAQLDYVQPDVSFTDTNSRFDLTEMMNAQDKAHRDIPLADDDDDDEGSEGDYRRHLQNSQGEKKQDKAGLTRRADSSFAYHDRMDSKEGGTMSDFEENLKHFQIIKEPSRRHRDYEDHSQYKRFRRRAVPTAESEILMNHVVPIMFKVDGYLKPPL